VASGAERRIDVGEVDDRIFINSVGFAFDAAVLRAMVGRTWPPGAALYLRCALEQIFRFRGVDVAVGGAMRRHLLLVIANGARFGGSFLIAPTADLSDGLLDIIAVLDASPLRRARLFAAALRGAHIDLAEVEQTRAASVSLTFREPPSFQLDGDLYVATRADLVVRCIPAALRVVSGATVSPGATSGSAR
jgi:diacylglycerol kinase family enzyme